jgi:secreted trypsin-like serine protease
MKPRWLMLAVFAAVVVATLALAGVASAQADDRSGPQPLVVGGTPVPNGKYPFMASLQADVSGAPPPDIFGGGTLIDADSVLTGGHNVEFIGNTTDQDTLSFREVRVVVGTTVLSSGQGQVRRIASLSDISIHPRLNLNRSFAYDVAVIDLARPVRGIRPIKLAAVGSDAHEEPGRRATGAGWGSTLAVDPDDPEPPVQFPDRMREARVPIVSDQQCARAYNAPGIPPDFRVFPELMVCAGAEGVDLCFGDSGGPMFVTADGGSGQIRYRQIGVLSSGLGCAAEGFPSIYTEVSAPSIGQFIRDAKHEAGETEDADEPGDSDGPGDTEDDD